MTVSQLGRSPSDRAFVEAVEQMLSKATTSVGVIAGELSAYDIPSLKQAAHEAAAKGARIVAYANEPDDKVIREIRSHKGRVKVGNLRSRHHYLVTDGLNVIVSEKAEGAGRTQPGSRHGLIYRGEPEMAQAVQAYLRFLDDAATGVGTGQVLNDLLCESLRHPTLAREIPFAENVLTLLGMTPAEAKRSVEQMRRRFATWTEGGGLPAGGEKVLDAIVNGACLLVAIAAMGDLRDVPDRWSAGEQAGQLSLEDVVQLDPSDIERVDRIRSATR